jgi:hypothetical protein
MLGIVKCPKTNELSSIDGCMACPNFLQFLNFKNTLECEIDWIKHITTVYDADSDARVDEIWV